MGMRQTRVWRLGVIFLLVLLLPGGVVLANEGAIGIIKIASGSTFILRDGQRSLSQPGDALFQNDVLETADDGSLGVTFKDNTRLSLGPNSRITVDEFIFNPGIREFSFITRVTRGTLIYLSGLMAKLSPESVSVKTPVATIGIRGTRFLVRIDEDEKGHQQ